MAFPIFMDMKKYYQQLDKATKGVAPDKLFRKNWIHMIIDRIESTNNIIKNYSIDKVQQKVRETLEKYFVKEFTRTQKPFKKDKKLYVRVEGTSEALQAIPLTDTFQIVKEAHLATNHGGIEAMVEWLKNSGYIVASVCLDTIVDICTGCPVEDDSDFEYDQGSKDVNEYAVIKESEIPVLKESEIERMVTENEYMENEIKPEQVEDFRQVNEEDMAIKLKEDDIGPEEREENSTALINIMSMNEKNEKSDLDHLLIYQDNRTKFLQLRPVSSRDIGESVTCELLQLFSDIGVPDTIQVPEILVDLFTPVLKCVKQIFNKEIKIFKIHESDSACSDISLKIDTAIKYWIVRNPKINVWSIGCYSVQFQLNQMHGEDGISPFEKSFGVSLDIMGDKRGNVKCQNEKNTNSGIDEFIKVNPVIQAPSDHTYSLI